MPTYRVLSKHKTLGQAKKKSRMVKKEGKTPLITYEKGKFRVYSVHRSRKKY